MKTQSKITRNQILVRINPKIYPLEVVYMACYVFLNKAYVALDGDPKKEIKVSLKAKEKLTLKKLRALKGEFLNELLNYSLRNEISKRNIKIREYIVGQALFALNPEGFEEEEEPTEGGKDVLGITVPWKEQKKSKPRTVRGKKKKATSKRKKKPKKK